VFEIFSGYFVNILYNNLYVRAKDDAARHDKSITDAYRRIVCHYAQGIKSDSSNYSYVVKQLHEYYRDATQNHLLMFQEFENNILSQFIPEEYFDDLNNKEKDKLLSNIINEIVRRVCNMVIAKHVRYVIDERGNDHVRIMQDELIDNLLFLRDEYFTKFANKVNGEDEAKKDTGSVPFDVAMKIKQSLSEQLRRRCEAERDRDRAIAILKQAEGKLRSLTDELEAARNEASKCAAELTRVRLELKELREQQHNSAAPPVRQPSPPPPVATSQYNMFVEDDEDEDDTDEDDDPLAEQRRMIEERRLRSELNNINNN
jgi:hypothetical protein